MISALEPLAGIPGVEVVMLVAHDGVPIAIKENRSGQAQAVSEEALSALATSWLSELGHAVGPLSWEEPSRVVMRCTRGTLVVRSTKRAVLLVLMAKGLAPEDVRLSMDGVLARIERGLRNMGGDSRPPQKDHEVDTTSHGAKTDRQSVEDPRGPIPSSTRPAPK